MNVIDSTWYGKTGIVKVDTGFEVKWYIGEGFGVDQHLDEQHIAMHGMPVYPQVLEGFFNMKKQQNEHS